MKPTLGNNIAPLLRNFGTVLLGALILSSVAFFNGYPLVYSDTATYIMSGKDMLIPVDRPIAYGLFIAMFGSLTLWFVTIAQNLLTSYILFRTVKLLLPGEPKTNGRFYGIIIFLTTFSAVGWYSNQIMPDFLTPLMILAIFILFYQQKIKVLQLVLISLLLIFSILTHFSHLLIASSLSTMLVAGHFVFFKKRSAANAFIIPAKRAILVWVIACSGWLLLPALNFCVSGEYYQSKSSHAFFMASMADKGILSRFLKEKCDKPGFSDCKLCQFKNKAPRDIASFLWDSKDSSFFNLTGGWYNSQYEYNKVIRATLVDPKYLSHHVFMFGMYGTIQLFQNKIGHGLGAYREDSAPAVVIQWKYSMDYNTYLNSKQNLGGNQALGLNTINSIHYLLLIISVLMLVYVFFSSRRHEFNRMSVLFILVMITAIAINAYVTAGLSAPYGRYQTRVVWLLEFSLILFGMINWKVLKNSVYHTFRKED